MARGALASAASIERREVLDAALVAHATFEDEVVEFGVSTLFDAWRAADHGLEHRVT